MREYEVVFVVKATETDEVIDALVDQMQEIAKQQGAEVVKVEKWGRRKLAYDIGKQRDGFYVLIGLTTEHKAVVEMERKLKMNDAVIRFLSVRIDDEVRRATRRALLRAKRKGVDPASVPIPGVRRSLDADKQDEDEDEPMRDSDEDEDEGEV